MKTQPEGLFSHPIAIDRLGPDGVSDEITADARQCADIAKFLDVVAVNACRVAFAVKPWRKEGFKVSGRVSARIVHTCVVSLDAFEADLEEDFARYFLRHNAPGPRADIVTVDPLDDDEPESLEGTAIDVGAIALESLALGIDPYPRKPGVSFTDSARKPDAPDDDTAKPSPFAVLESLKPRD